MMLASVLNSHQAIDVAIYVVRAFVRLRNILETHRDLADKLREIEQKVSRHDADLQEIVQALRQLMTPEGKPKRQIGFHIEEPKSYYGSKKPKK